MRTGFRKNEAHLEHLPIEIQTSKFIHEKLEEGDRWITVFEDPKVIQQLIAETQTLDENPIIHFHKKDIEKVFKKNNILKTNENFAFGVEYHKDTKNIYFVLKEKKEQYIAGKGFFVYVKILQNIQTKNFIARKTEIFKPYEYEQKLLETKNELRMLSKAYGIQNISYALRFTRAKGFFAKLLGFKNALPRKIDIYMPWIPGIELLDFINNLEVGEKQELLSYKVILATALELHRLHKMKIIHGDIKPENIKVCIENDEVISLHIFDFNLSLKATHTMIEDGHEIFFARSNRLHGTPAYLDPRIKQSVGCIYSSKSDTFPLLMMLFEMLTRTTPSFAESKNKETFRKLSQLRSKLITLEFPAIEDAVFLSSYLLEKDDPYPTLQTVIDFLKDKISKLSLALDEKKPSLRRLVSFKSDKIGLFGKIPEKKEEHKEIDISISLT